MSPRQRGDNALPLIVAIATAATIPGAVVERFADDPLSPTPLTHFVLVVATALAAAVASTVLSIAGARRGDGRIVLLGTAFSTMTALLAVHGFATPGVLAGDNGVGSIAGGLSLPAGAGVLALTALPALQRPQRMAPLITAQMLIACLIVALGACALVAPSLIQARPQAGGPGALTLMTAGLAMLSVIALRAIRTWQLSRRSSDLIAALGVAWLAVALVAQMTIPADTVGYYAGHAMQLAGVVALALPTVLDMRKPASSRALVGDLTAAELVTTEEAFLGSHVHTLLVTLSVKDTATEDHTRRVAVLAVQLGERLGLPAKRLRTLAVGGLLHDIGKLSVPSAVLQKPGALNDEEFAEIRKHPAEGVRLLERLGGFAPSVLRLVHDHHERLDGSGYPRGLRGDDLDLETRILAVCDVYDALVSNRVYRSAWSPERALALLDEEAGTRMDAQCVAALKDLVRPPFVATMSDSSPLTAVGPARAVRSLPH
ncbi:MAG: HD-GYP domain-containing protein [Actinomycetota bacterium]|nr:HD-GYP domain-containing protein [Actinomycetota bacterium]